jgi:CrcB protein
MSFTTILWIALGGGLGTILRYVVGKYTTENNHSGFPLGTLLVNLLGCLLIGVIYSYFEKHHSNDSDWKLILTVGFCGGFTTFSAFSADNLQLMRDGRIDQALLYTAVTVFGGFLLTYLGTLLIKS